MPRYFRKMALRSKIETTYGTDAVPTGSANAILAHDVRFTELAGGEDKRDLILPYMGHQGVVLTGNYAMIEFGVELAGAGAPGDVPAYGALLRSVGMSEEIDPGVAVIYKPVSGAFEAVSHYFDMDGVRHVLLGSRGNWTAEWTPSLIPRLRFRMLALLGIVSDQALPVVDLSGFVEPVPVSKANTTFSLHGYAGATERVTIDLGQKVEPRLLINHESIQISDRESTATAVMEATTLATKNWRQIALNRTTGTMALQHGTVDGNIVELGSPKAQVGRYGEGQTQGIVNNTFPLMLIPDEGNDEVVLTVR